ncbi:hypothetical protein STEG23_030039, partial [Scotinomys teguina]
QIFDLQTVVSCYYPNRKYRQDKERGEFWSIKAESGVTSQTQKKQDVKILLLLYRQGSRAGVDQMDFDVEEVFFWSSIPQRYLQSMINYTPGVRSQLEEVALGYPEYCLLLIPPLSPPGQKKKDIQLRNLKTTGQMRHLKKKDK